MGDPETSNLQISSAASDRASGSAEIARAAAEGLSGLPRESLSQAVRALLLGHPGMGALWRLCSAVLSAEDHTQAARDFLAAAAGEPEEIGRRAGQIFSGTVLTFSYSSTMVAALDGLEVSVLCAESAPEGEGRRTAEALGLRGIDARVVSDDQALLEAGRVAAVVAGADAITPRTFSNKTGTRALAEAARLECTPLYILAGRSKFVPISLPPEPSIEEAPIDLASAVIAEDAALSPEEAVIQALGVRLHPDLLILARAMGEAKGS